MKSTEFAKTENQFPPNLKAILKRIGATVAFANTDIYVKKESNLLIMFSYVKSHPLVIVTIASTKHIGSPNETTLSELNSKCVVGTHVKENDQYMFRGNIWLDSEGSISETKLESIIDRMTYEAEKAITKINNYNSSLKEITALSRKVKLRTKQPTPKTSETYT